MNRRLAWAATVLVLVLALGVPSAVGAVDGRPLAGHTIAIDPVLGHTTGDMGMVVLHRNFLYMRLVSCIACAQVIGMKIIGNYLRVNVQDALHVINCHFEKCIGRQIFKISDMLA